MIEKGIISVASHCPRGRGDCSALSHIISSDGQSFVCFGRNDGTTRCHEQDKYRYCCVAPSGIDEIQDVDRRDAMHQATVILTGLSIAEEITE